MRRSRLVLFGFVFIIVALTAGSAWAITATPPLEEQIPGSPVSVQIVNPLNGEFFDSNVSIPIQVYATSPNNVVSIEIWANGQLLDVQAVSQQFPMAAKTSYPWNSPAPGVQALMARAKDAQGYTGQSSVALVTVKAVTPMNEYTTSAGDSFQSVADFLGMDEDEIMQVNPGLDPGAVFGDGQSIQLPLPPEPEPSGVPVQQPLFGGTPQEAGAPPNPIIYKFKEITSQWSPPKSLPTPPLLIGTIENCSQAKLTVVPQSSNEDGYFVYRWVYGEQSLAFQNVMVLGLGGAEMQPITYTEPMMGLAAFYYVSAFNTVGEVSSAPIALMYDETCLSGQGGQGPDHTPLLGDLETSIAVNQSYCYYSTKAGEWQRFPSQEFEFIKPGKDNFGLNMMIVDPPPVVVMECWGFGGGSLLYLGKAEKQLSADPVTLVGEKFSFTTPSLPMLKSSDGPQENVQTGNEISNLINKKVPAPINLREAEDPKVCDQHISGYGCQPLMNKQIKEEYLLIWDWVEGTCWGPEENCPWLKNDYPKFNLYMVNNPVPVSGTYDTGIVTPLPWGYQCFYVTASVDTAIGEIESAPSNTYCPNQKNPPKVMVLKPTNIITQRQASLYQCLTPPKDPAAGLGTDQMMVGVYDTACWDQKFQGAVMFDLTQFYNQVSGYSLQKATLRFDKGSTTYQSDSPGHEESSNLKPLCGLQLGWVTGTGEWKSWNPTTALQGGYTALTFKNPIQSLPVFGASKVEVNVTDFVDYYQWNNWNGGLGLFTNINLLADKDLYNKWVTNNICLNQLQNFELEIQYYPLGQ
jgi:LysM repeat protein